jgi:hypothetical protein
MSLDALREASENAHFKDKGSMWAKTGDYGCGALGGRGAVGRLVAQSTILVSR